jgi:chromosome partitioning protein
MTIITVCQQKGGVGKTTLAVCLAGELCRRGGNVALVDADPQRSSSQWATPGNLEFPVYELSLDGVSVGHWASEVRAIRADPLVIDTAPNERHLGASIALADLVLVPCTASGLDIEATARTISIIQAVRDRRHNPMAVVLVPNRIDRRTLEGQQLEEELRGFGECVAPAIGARTSFVRAFSTGESIASSAAGGAADADIQRLCDVVQHELAVLR